MVLVKHFVTGHFLSLCLMVPLIILSNPAQAKYSSSHDLLEIVFSPSSTIRMIDGRPVDVGNGNMPALNGLEFDLTFLEWHRIADVDEAVLDDIHERAENALGLQVINLNNIYRLRTDGLVDIWRLAEAVESLTQVIRAMPVPLPMPLPTPPNYQSNQGYLASSASTPSGIDAVYAWTQTGGTGTGVTVCDIEYDWNYNHLDITQALGSQLRSTCSTGLPAAWQHHGTGVIGMLSANNNGWGITGICYGASLRTCCSLTGTYPPGTWDLPGALTTAIAGMTAGDVILLEQQWDYSSSTSTDQFIPIEWWGSQDGAVQTANAVYAAIQNAVGSGIHVIEPAGNGSYNLDSLTWYGDSGAIVVGAGGVYTGGTYTEGDLQRLSFSSYGNRVNLQGWGENVYTTGSGDLYSSEGLNYYYTSQFSGTSSASPVVAGAVACCVGYWTHGLGYTASSLTPSTLRSILVNTGTAQITPPSGNIGPRPNLQAAFSALAAMTPTPGPTPTPTSTPTIPPPPADYGDAPDQTLAAGPGWDAYSAMPGFQAAHFPTIYNTAYSMYSHGICFVSFSPYLSAAGVIPSLELDAIDPVDPDGVPNIDPAALIANRDAHPAGDDGIVFSFAPEGITVYLHGSPGFLCMLADLNQDGDWNEPAELVLNNQPVAMMGGPQFIPMPGVFGMTTGHVWVRVVVSQNPLNFPGWPLWDGSVPGPLSNGEVEDYLIDIPGPGTPTATPPTPMVPSMTNSGTLILLIALSLLLIVVARRIGNSRFEKR